MMPVPSIAGCIRTLAEPCLPITACCSVPFFSFTLKSLRRASSIAFCTATGTSRALPLPMPMPPSPSPTTVSAAKPSTRPPFTTLVTRFTATIFSRRPSPRSSCCIRGWIFAMGFPLELQAAGARRFGECLDATVVAIAGTIERDLVDAFRLGLARDALADSLGGLAVGAVLELPAHFLLRARGADQHFVARGRGDLRIDVRIRAMHGQAHRADFANLVPGLLRPTEPGVVFAGHGYFFFVSLRTMTSLA